MFFVFKKQHIRILDEFLSLQANEPIRHHAFSISEEQTLDVFHVQSCLFFIQHLHISHTIKNAHVGDVQQPLVPRLLWHHSFHGLGWTPVAYVHCIAHPLYPKFMAEALGMSHGPCHLHDGLIGSLCHHVLLWGGMWRSLLTTCFNCLFTKVFHTLNLSNILLLALSTYTQILRDKSSMKVEKYLTSSMDMVFISLHTSESTSSKIFMRAGSSNCWKWSPCLFALDTSFACKQMQICLVPRLHPSHIPCFEAFSCYFLLNAPSSCVKAPKNESLH